MFRTELEMSKKFEKFLKENFGNSYFKEYQGLFGIPDFIFYSKDKNEVSIISFELKLKDWKRASMQAFRYKSFSHISYVVLPANRVVPALTNIELFKKYNIGLAKFDNESTFEILFKPLPNIPFSEVLHRKLINNIGKSRKISKNCEILFSYY